MYTILIKIVGRGELINSENMLEVENPLSAQGQIDIIPEVQSTDDLSCVFELLFILQCAKFILCF